MKITYVRFITEYLKKRMYEHEVRIILYYVHTFSHVRFFLSSLIFRIHLLHVENPLLIDDGKKIEKYDVHRKKSFDAG